MGETLKEVIIWCFTSGTLTAVVTWFISRKQNRAKASKGVEFIYKEMLDDVKDTLNKLSKDYNELYDMQLATQKAVAQSGVCTHIAICPVRHELRRQKASRARLQPQGANRCRDDTDKNDQADNSTSELCGIDSVSGEPP